MSTSAKIQLIKGQHEGVQFCEDLLVIFALEHGVHASVNQQTYHLQFGGLLVINPYSHYNISCFDESIAVVLNIPDEVLRLTNWDAKYRIDCYVEDDNAGVDNCYNNIRVCFAKLFKMLLWNAARDTQIVAELMELLTLFSNHFLTEEAQVGKRLGRKKETWQRYDEILHYIHLHWNEPLTATQIAQHVFISTGYLTRFFKQHMGTTVTEYLTEVRLEHALQDLTHSEKSVTEIACSNGFTNTNSFIKQFRERYSQTPKQYQLKIKNKLFTEPMVLDASADQTRLSSLLQYTSLEERLNEKMYLPDEYTEIKGDISQDGIPLRHTWHRLLNIGYARDVLLSNVQEQLKRIQEEIGFEYLRFHGILDDDMHVYHEDVSGKPFLDFSRVDMLLDFVLSCGLKPYIELSFMPKLLIRDDHQFFDRTTYVSIYKNEEKWCSLIQNFIQHCIELYGRKQVRTWKFTTIGNNMVSVGMIEQDDYLRLYRVTYESVKKVDMQLQFGGPGGYSSALWEERNLRHFLSYIKNNSCIPDFFNLQCYPYASIEQDSDFLHFTISQTSAPSILSSDESYTKNMLDSYRKLLEEYQLSSLPIWIEEWNSTLWQRDLASDTCYKSAWMVKNLCETYDQAESFGYWLLTDFIEERSDFGGVFHGGYGLFTYNGIPKSGYLAMQLMNHLGNKLIATGNGWMITKSQAGIQVLLSHYCHYDRLYRLRYQRLTDPKEAYNVFVEHGKKECVVSLTGLCPGRYELKKYSISPEYGSSFDVWLRIGAPQYLREQEKAYLQRAAQPNFYVERMELGTDYQFTTTLRPHETQLFLLELMGD